MDVSNRHILVTGGAGFIGSNLIDRLLRENADVVCLDNFSTGKRENLAHLANHPHFRLIEGDIRDTATCREAMKGIDGVFHEAALGSVPRSIKDPGTTTEVNIAGFVNILDAARFANVRRVVYASSSSVYGDETRQPKIEDRVGSPLSPYALTKWANELFAANFHRVYGMDLIGLRYFNVYGRRQDPQGAYAAVIPRFADAILHHRAPVIYGDGSNSRDFTYIDDVIQANLLAMTVETPAALNTVYNVAEGSSTTLNELFSALRTELSRFDRDAAAVEAQYAPPRPGDIPHSLASIQKAREILHYAPAHPMADGLRLTAEWYYRNSRGGTL